MKIILAGAGAFGQKHLDAIKAIGGIEVASLVGRELEPTRETAKRYGIPHATTDLTEALALTGVSAAILCTPTQIHAAQAIQCLNAGKHVQVEIPLADSWRDAEAVGKVQRDTGLVCMVGHTRRFNPSHQWVHRRIVAGELNIQQMDVQTFFFRRTNTNALGQPRSWTDHLLWHHAAHTVDLFTYQAGAAVTIAHAIQGPIYPQLGIAMDMSIQLKVKDRKIDVSKVEVSMNGIELQDREFFAAISGKREPNASVHQVLPCYRTLHELERQLSTSS